MQKSNSQTNLSQFYHICCCKIESTKGKVPKDGNFKKQAGAELGQAQPQLC